MLDFSHEFFTLSENRKWIILWIPTSNFRARFFLCNSLFGWRIGKKLPCVFQHLTSMSDFSLHLFIWSEIGNSWQDHTLAALVCGLGCGAVMSIKFTRKISVLELATLEGILL